MKLSGVKELNFVENMQLYLFILGVYLVIMVLILLIALIKPVREKLVEIVKS